MTNILSLVQAAIRKRGGSLNAISPVAQDICDVVSHQIDLIHYDRDKYNERLKAMEARIVSLEQESRK